MKLERLTDRIWYYPFEQERDRPNLGYIRGDKWSIAVDAGHSREHTEEFYSALRQAGLPLPTVTVITHWHWDHTFGMHAANGLCLANVRTNKHLREFAEHIKGREEERFFSIDERIRREYEGGKPVIVTLADMVFSGEMTLDPGGCPVRIFQSEAPHTDDTTLIHAVNEKVLFLGDSLCGSIPDWKADPAKLSLLGETIRNTDADICLDGHYIPQTKQDVLNDIANELDSDTH